MWTWHLEHRTHSKCLTNSDIFYISVFSCTFSTNTTMKIFRWSCTTPTEITQLIFAHITSTICSPSLPSLLAFINHTHPHIHTMKWNVHNGMDLFVRCKYFVRDVLFLNEVCISRKRNMKSKQSKEISLPVTDGETMLLGILCFQ